MPRYFLELSYKGADYSGFQLQHNANTIQAEVERTFEILLKHKVSLTGSSRTDAGVHALQNYFHFDISGPISDRLMYKLNAILPDNIVIKNILPVKPAAHCRFDAISREYIYYIYRQKDPFQKDRAFYFPYRIDIKELRKAAALVMKYEDFTSFSKRNTQVKSFACKISKSEWHMDDNLLIYNVVSNRFLRGMVRALTATMLKVGRGKVSLDDFETIIQAKDCTKASFAVPAHGLFLAGVNYPRGYFETS